MNKLSGWIVAGGLLLGHASASNAQVTIQRGVGGSPTITFGQPAYGQYPPSYAQPNYAQPGYVQPRFTQPGYVQPNRPAYYSSGYSGYYAPGTATNQGYYNPGYRAPTYAAPYGQQPRYYTNGNAPYSRSGTGVIINGRSYMLPR